MRQLSLKQHTLRYVLIMLSLVISISLISFVSIKSLLDENQQQKQLEGLKIKAYNVSVRINFYRNIIATLAQGSKTKELVIFGEQEEAQKWAQRTQLLIPDSIGVALFNEDGSILGRKKVLKVGKLCYADLHNHIQDIPFKKPTVHRANPAFAHFDLFSNIIADDENIGVLFASIRLSVLQTLLDELTEQGEHLQLYTGDNELVVETNHYMDKNSVDQNTIHIPDIPVRDTDWYLKAHIEQNKLTDVLVYIALTNSILFILLSFILYIFSDRLVKTFSSDFKTIHNMLIGLKNHEMSATNIRSRLSETEDIVIDIQNIAEDISESQQQLVKFSLYDDLTGLLNRRGFNQESARCIDLANRDIESTIISLDLDYFKQINDNLGHATGDKMLEILADCIKSTSRTVDVAARLGGDEFCVILVKCSIQQAIRWYEKLSAEFMCQQSQQFELPDDIKPCSLSAGCTLIDEKDTQVSALLSRADEALYSAKASGRANIKSYVEQ